MSVESWQHENGFRWDHAKLDDEGRAWLADQGLDRLVIQALTAADTRPRVTSFGDGAVIVLRGVNLNEGAEPEDMISARVWVEPHRVVSVWLRPLRAMRNLRDLADQNQGPGGGGELISRLALGLTDTAAPVIGGLSDRVDELEEAMVDPQREPSQDELSDLRRVVIMLKRYFTPQRDVVAELRHMDAAWLVKRDRHRLSEAVDRLSRLTEELEELGHRTQVLQDHLVAHRADRLNNQMFVLSVVAALFLPLGFVTGLLGINVGGMPGVDSASAFWIVCAILVVLGVVQWLLFRAFGIVGRK